MDRYHTLDESCKQVNTEGGDESNETDSAESSADDSLSESMQCRIYWYRWYICFIFSFMSLFQGAIMDGWGPIDESADAAFGFGSSEVELLTNWGAIAFLIFMPFFMWCLDNKGFRLNSVSAAFFIALGSGLRCLPVDVSILRYFIHVGQVLNGIASCVVLTAPPYLSNLWFPPDERITATGIATLFNFMGTGVAYALGLTVDVPSNSTENTTKCIHSFTHEPNNTCYEVVLIRQQIKDIFYIEFGVALAIFISMLIFYPDRPPTPPSVSASMPRQSLKEGLLKLRRHGQFWIVAMVMALIIGTWSSWIGVMPIILEPLNISQTESCLIGIIMTVVGCVTGMLVGWLTDRLKGRMRMMLTIVFSLALSTFLYFIIISNEWIKVVPFLPGLAEVWTVCVIFGILMNASIPLGLEMGADAAYPVSEITSASIIVWFGNCLSFVLLLVLGYLPSALDANYIIFACLVVSVPALIFFTDQKNRRLELDTGVENGDSIPPKEHGTFNPNYIA